MNLLGLLLPLGIQILKSYIASSDSKKDDKVLEVVQDSCEYLVAKDNNDLTEFSNVVDIASTVIKKID